MLSVLSLRVNALQSAFSSLTEVVTDALKTMNANSDHAGKGMRRVGADQERVDSNKIANEVMVRVMASMLRSEVALEERMRKVIVDSISSVEAKFDAKSSDEENIDNEIHLALSAIEERSLANDIAIRERVVEIEDRITNFKRHTEEKINNLQNQQTQLEKQMNELKVKSMKATSEDFIRGSTVIRDIITTSDKMRSKINNIENRYLNKLDNLQQQQYQTVIACEALATDISSIAEETKSVRELCLQSNKLNVDRFEHLIKAELRKLFDNSY